MRASLADQGGFTVSRTLAIGLGANLPSPAGSPVETLAAVRPLLESLLWDWVSEISINRCIICPPKFHWSAVFVTAPWGGLKGQPDYTNAVLVVEFYDDLMPCLSVECAKHLLVRLQGLEAEFGRQRMERWGPRSLDLDLLWVSMLKVSDKLLSLPHPLMLERAFILEPLASIDPAFSLIGLDPSGRSVLEVLMTVLKSD